MDYELRYLVAKITDAKDALSSEEMASFYALLDKVEAYRKASGKEPLSGLFVETDWPEFPFVKETIANRVDGKPTPLSWGDTCTIPHDAVFLNPYTGFPRDARDVMSDPYALLILGSDSGKSGQLVCLPCLVGVLPPQDTGVDKEDDHRVA